MNYLGKFEIKLSPETCVEVLRMSDFDPEYFVCRKTNNFLYLDFNDDYTPFIFVIKKAINYPLIEELKSKSNYQIEDMISVLNSTKSVTIQTNNFRQIEDYYSIWVNTELIAQLCISKHPNDYFKLFSHTKLIETIQSVFENYINPQ